jgi:hypothetical protein
MDSKYGLEDHDVTPYPCLPEGRQVENRTSVVNCENGVSGSLAGELEIVLGRSTKRCMGEK